ncbi:MAG: copper chaperone PCu(A)C [Rhizobiaceae bacterium]|nr:copper chaperone PCu(A)C [Rhizobiaceae bacterium]
MKYLVTLFAFFFSTLTHASDLMVMDPWVPLAPPAAKAHAAFVMIHNHSGSSKTLISASSDNYKMVHIHKSEEKDGVATMSMVEQIEIPADGMLAMKPGGLHIMLLGPKSTVNLGDEIKITLNFEDGTSVDINALVKKRHAHTQHNH